MIKRATIDIGSNTVLLLAVELEDNVENYKELLNESRVTSLGKDLDKTGVFHPDSIRDTYAALKEYKVILNKIGIDSADVIVTATEASRVAKNSNELFQRVESELGLKISIINAEGEAYYTSLGVVRAHRSKESSVVIMDIGGASTELILIETSPFRIIKSISLAVGSVRATDWIAEGSFEEKMEKILSNKEIDSFSTEFLLCVAGSMTSLAGMINGLQKFDSSKVNGSVIAFDKYLSFYRSIEGRKPEELLETFPFLGKRAKSILAGAELGLKMGKRLNIKTFEISTFGLRYGTLFAGAIDKKYGEL